MGRETEGDNEGAALTGWWVNGPMVAVCLDDAPDLQAVLTMFAGRITPDDVIEIHRRPGDVSQSRPSVHCTVCGKVV